MSLFSPDCRLLYLAPHPDDESLAGATLLARAAEAAVPVRVLFLTDGDDNPWPQRVVERRVRIQAADRRRWGARRREEALAALRELGLRPESARFLTFPDQGISRHLLSGGEELLGVLVEEILGFRPTVVVAPSLDDLHADHSAVALLMRLALERSGEAGVRPEHLEYAIHDRRVTQRNPEAVLLELSPEEQERKRRAILCHKTQISLSRSRFLAYARETERFVPAGGPPKYHRPHPLRAMRVEDEQWVLRLEPRACPGSFGPCTLLMVATTGGQVTARWRVELPASGGAPVECLENGEIIARALVQRGSGGRELRLPLRAIPGAERWYVKLERRCGFFDEAGWTECAAPVPAAPESRLRKPRVCAVIPCYNVAALCAEVVRAAVDYADTVLAVDDGSTDGTGQVLREIAGSSEGRVRLLALEKNGGKGAALLAGFRHALEEIPFDLLVTLDGDRQHRPEDIPRLVRAAVRARAGMVVGERFSGDNEHVPLRSRIGNTLAAAMLRRRYPACPSDTQSGLRALRRDLVEEIVEVVPPGRYETELQMLLLSLGQGYRVATVPIPTIYLDGNKSSHFRPLEDALCIYRAMLRWEARPPAVRRRSTAETLERV